MIRALIACAALTSALPAAPAALAAPAAASEAGDLAESRLRGCLLAGSSAAPQTSLHEAVVQVRAFCLPQINRVRGIRARAATAGLSGKAVKAAEDTAIRALNDEIARTIANFTGLTR